VGRIFLKLKLQTERRKEDMNEPTRVALEKNLRLALQYTEELAPEYWVVRNGDVLKVARELLTPDERELIAEQLRSAAQVTCAATPDRTLHETIH
jgi:hypothetical protein